MRKAAQLSPEVWEAIPAEIKERGYYSVGEIAWYKEDALKVLEIIKELGYGVIGIDIWIPAKPGPRVPQNIRALDLNELQRLEWERLVVESHERAKDFICTLRDRVDARINLHGMEPVFNTKLHSIEY